MEKFFRFSPFKLLIMLFLIFSSSLVENCIAQTANIKTLPIPPQYQTAQKNLVTFHQQVAAAKSNAYDLTKSLPQGYVTDGSVDYTSNLQQAINSHTNVVFPDFPVLVDPLGISLKSNTIVIFDEKSKIVVKPSAAANYQILKLNNLQNVTVYFPMIVGDRENHIGTKGQWGMGIFITGSSNIKIINPKISDCWGDGIYIGKQGNAINKDIGIYYAQLDHNRRNGISIICADGLKLVCPVVTNSNGVLPMAGIDIEPNDNTDEINNIEMYSPITFNGSYGIAIAIDRLAGKNVKNVNIKITGHVDDNSKNSLLLAFTKQPSDAYTGTISIDSPAWRNTDDAVSVYDPASARGLKIKFSNIKMWKKDGPHHEILDHSKMLNVKNTIAKQLKADIN